jgi:adenine deaminase
MDVCEAEEKLALGMKILIREGSAAKNFDALYPLINQYPSAVNRRFASRRFEKRIYRQFGE